MFPPPKELNGPGQGDFGKSGIQPLIETPKAAMAIVVRATCNHVYSLCLVACSNATGVVVSVAHYAFEICRENSVTTHL